MEVGQLLGLQGFWQHQVLWGIGGSDSRKYSALEGDGSQDCPVHSIFLAWRPSVPDREAWQDPVYKVTELDTTEATLPAQTQDFSACGSSAPES